MVTQRWYLLILVLAIAPLSGSRNYFLQFPVLQVRSDDTSRDIEAFDRAATKAGFDVVRVSVPYTYENRRVTTLRSYKAPAQCCFSLSLGKWDEEPMLELLVHDTDRSEHPFRESDCAMYARFRAALAAEVAPQRIILERRPCSAEPSKIVVP